MLMINEISMGCDVEHRVMAQQSFTAFMHEQIQCIDQFRQQLCRQQDCEISHEYAVRVWIERGYAAAFRQRFEKN